MDHYAALGVSPNAGNAEINNAFKRKTNAIIAAPNNNITRRHTLLRNAAAERKVLKNSYNLLKNKGRRNEYNKTRKVPNSEAIDYTYVIDNLTKYTHYPYPQWDPDGIIKFQKGVNDMLKKGYKLHGDVILTYGVMEKSKETYGVESNNMIYQIMIKGIDGEQYNEYKILPIRMYTDEQVMASLLPNEMKYKDKFLKDITKHLNEGWKLYNGPVELGVNSNLENRYAPRGYIYQAIIR